MTDTDWEQSDDPDYLLESLEGGASARKLLLFSVACCRRVWELMTDPRQRQVVEAAERLAEGWMTQEEFDAVMEPITAQWAALPDAVRETGWKPRHCMAAAVRHLRTGSACGALFAAWFAARGRAFVAGREGEDAWHAALAAERTAQCHLLRNLFGKPLVPFRFDPAWRAGPGGTAVQLARTIYDDAYFERLPELADMLERSGYYDSVVLEHCRGPGPHARGCWVVDALLDHEPALHVGLLTEADWQACADLRFLLHFLRDRGSSRKWRLFSVACCRRIAHLIADERSRRALAAAARFADGAITEAELEAANADATTAWDEAREKEYPQEAEANYCITPPYAEVSCRCCAAAAVLAAVRFDPRPPEPDSEDLEGWEGELCSTHAAWAVRHHVYATLGIGLGDARWAQANAAATAAREAERRAQCVLLHDLFGEYLGPPGEEGDWLPCAGQEEHYTHDRQWCLLPTTRQTVLRPEWLAWNSGLVRRLAEMIYEEEAFDRLPILADALEDAGCTDAALLAHLRGPTTHTRGCWALDAVRAQG